MALRSIAAFVAALGAWGVTALHADGCPPLRVAIHLRVDQSISFNRLTDGLKDETEAIWGRYGIQLEWTDASASEPAPNSVSLDAIVERRFEAPGRKEKARVLGSAFVKPDAPNWQPIRVSFEATETVLRTARPSIAGLLPDHELARALGRVLAHEVGHLLLGAPYHDGAGLMRAAFRPDELAAVNPAPFNLTRASVLRLRSRLPALTRRDSSGGASCMAFQPAR